MKLTKVKWCNKKEEEKRHNDLILERVRMVFMIKIADIKKEFLETDIDEIDAIIEKYKEDERSGVQKMIEKAYKEKEKLAKERARLEVMREFEHKYAEYEYICGIDEVGRGPLAGPVIAAAVILPKDCEILYLNDSKQVSEKKREELYDIIMEKAIAVGIGSSSHAVIDDINILNATYVAMREAINNLKVTPDLLLNDAVHIPEVKVKQVSLIKGDARSVSIAAASIIAKVTRDRLMTEYDQVFPGYGFASNKGYGSKEHIEVLKSQGPCAIHRHSFIGNFVNDSE